MRLFIEVNLDSGGSVTIHGEGLSAEAVNEVFTLLSGYTVLASPELEPEE